MVDKTRKPRPEPELEQPKITNNNVELILADPEFQRGLTWRANKIRAIHTALANGHDDKWILYHLQKGGLTLPTAKRLLTDALLLAEGPPRQEGKKH